jgi:hypothetical protein
MPIKTMTDMHVIYCGPRTVFVLKYNAEINKACYKFSIGHVVIGKKIVYFRGF